MYEQLKRVAAFLQQYVKTADNSPTLPADMAMLKDAIFTLLDAKVMTVDEIRREALEEFDVIVPWWLFPDEVQKEKMEEWKSEK